MVVLHPCGTGHRLGSVGFGLERFRRIQRLQAPSWILIWQTNVVGSS